MAKEKSNHIKLGIFIASGLSFLILLLYIIGKNQNLFGNTFLIKARIDDVHGLRAGNNIRYAGIDIGTVKSVAVLNDSIVEVSLSRKSSMKGFIRKNATVNISTDGLMGNKLLNIVSAKQPAPVVNEGDVLYSSPGIDTDAMLKVLNSTNNDVATIAAELKQTAQRINQSKAFQGLLNDQSIPENIRLSFSKIRSSAEQIDNFIYNLNQLTSDLKAGKGSIGRLLVDTTMASELSTAINQLKIVGTRADSLSIRASALIAHVHNELMAGNGTVPALLTDVEMKDQLNATLKNIEEASKSLHENMDALKHSFLFRGYFKKMEKENEKAKPH
jgi:phospholipid/cholesterol/gamma-HCH transport system substrate-binding protein